MVGLRQPVEVLFTTALVKLSRKKTATHLALYLYVKRGESPALDFVSQKFRVVCKNVFLLCKVVILVNASTEHDIVGHFVGIKLTHSLKQLTYFISANDSCLDFT